MANARDILLNLIGKESISPAAKKAGDALDDLGDDAETTARKARKLDKDADELKRSLVGLAGAWTAAGSAADRADIAKAIRIDKGKLRETLNIRKLMDGVGQDGAGGFATGFVARLGPLMVSKMPMVFNPAVAAVAGPAAVLAVTLGTAVAGGIIGGVGIGGVVGGLAIASKHAAVKAEATAMGDEIGGVLQRSAVSFVPAAVKGISIIRDNFRAAEGDLTKLFSASARYVQPLAEGVGSAFRDVLAGVTHLGQRAAPVIDAIAGGIRMLGQSIRAGLEDLGDNANEGARALALLFTVVDYGVRTVFKLIDAFAETYGWMEKIGGALRGDFSPVIRDMYEDQMKAADGSGVLSEELQALLGGFQDTGSAAATAGTQFESFGQKLRGLQDQTIASMNAEIAYEAAIDDATAARKENGRTLDINTEKGRANMTALLGVASAARQNAEDIRTLTGSEDLATAAIEKGRNAFIKQATAMGMSRQRANELAAQLFGIPNVKRTVTVVTAQAEENLKSIRALIAAIKSKRVVITVDQRGRQTTRSEGRNVGIGDGVGGREYGGPVKAGHAYVVGEKRPEVFVPDRDGRIVPSIEKYLKTAGQPGGQTDWNGLARNIAREMASVLGPMLRRDNPGYTADLLVRGG